MRVLITGGAGFIGSHLVDRYLADGHDVTVIDNFSTGSPANLGDTRARLTVIDGAVEDRSVLEPALDGADLVFHLAAAVGVFRILKKPVEALHANLDGSRAVFELAAASGVRTVFSSTSEVYGKNESDALRESDDSIFGPTSVRRWLYAASKATDEFMALAYHHEHGLPVTVVRLFNTSGPRQSPAYGMVIPRFVSQALAGEPITVFGDGSQTRCFTNVFDVVECLERLARAPEAIGKVVNVGLPAEIAISELAELVRTVCGSDSPIENVPYRTAYGSGFEDMRRRVPDVRRLRELIGYVPSTPVEITVRQIAAQLGHAEAEAEGALRRAR